MKRFITISTWAGLLFSCIALLLFILIPFLLNTQLIPHLLKNNDVQGVTVQVNHLSPWSASGNISLTGKTDEGTLRAHFIIRYRPSDIIKRKVSSVTIDGITVRFFYADGKLRLQNPPFSTDQDSGPTDAYTLPSLPLMAETLHIDNCQILIEDADQVGLPTTLYATLRPEFIEQPTGNFQLKGLQVDLVSEGILPASLAATIQFNEDVSRLSLRGQFLETRSLTRLIQLPRDMQVHGPVYFEGEVNAPSSFHSFNTLDAQLYFPGGTITTDDFSLTSSKELPLHVQVNGTPKSLDYSVSNVVLTIPSQLEASVQGSFSPTSRTFSGKTVLKSALLQYPEELEFQGTLDPDNTELTVTLQGEKQQLQSGPNTIQLSSYQLSTQLHYKNDALLITENMQIGSVHIPEHDLLLENITSQMPITINSSTYPDKPGTLSIGKIHYKKENLADLQVNIEQNVEGAAFSGEIKSHMASPLRLKFSGTSAPSAPLNLKITLPQSTVNNRSFPSSLKLPAGMSFSGKVQASSTLYYAANSFSGTTTLSVKDGAIDDTEKNIHTSGMSTEIILPSLPQLSSQPHQELKIAKMDIGNLHFSDGSIFFHIEDAETFFIEKSRFTWCNGKVESGSLRIALNDPELSTTLYCDRLQFSELLNQVGIPDTAGDGSLNGRLPLHFNGKQMFFDDGFLFSTPGNSGIVRFNNTAMLRQGLPDMGQAAYLEYSMQAMENFAYNWTKLTFNTIGDDLLISMQIDGKPAEPLPFGYQSGQLVAKPEGQGIQHPIRLDVNFHLPFNQMFKYGQNLQKIMENMK